MSPTTTREIPARDIPDLLEPSVLPRIGIESQRARQPYFARAWSSRKSKLGRDLLIEAIDGESQLRRPETSRLPAFCHPPA
jgi:hypothetical protein